MLSETDDRINIVRTEAFNGFIPRDVTRPDGSAAGSQGGSKRATVAGSGSGSAASGRRTTATARGSRMPKSSASPRQGHHQSEDEDEDAGRQQVQMATTEAKMGKDTIQIQMEIKFPKKEKKKDIVEKKAQGSILSGIFAEQKFPEPVYFQNVDCVALPHFFTPKECQQIIDFAESQGFHSQQRHRVLNLSWSDLIDPYFGESVWTLCGLGWFLRTITIDGMVACGLNDVTRVQKYVQGNLFGRHIDQNVHRADGKVSKYSLRVFLNGSDDEFEGGMSIFHVPFRDDPVVFEPETGMALLYPQGNMCTVQEEAEVLFGCKYVLRADILFCPRAQLDGGGQ